MATTIGYTTSTLIESIIRKGMLPTSNKTFLEADFLAFANEEMQIGIVPSILQVHEQYFVWVDQVPLVGNDCELTFPNVNNDFPPDYNYRHEPYPADQSYLYTSVLETPPQTHSYPIPYRAIGMRLRDLFYKDDSGTLRKLTQISEEDQAYYQNSGGNRWIAFYFQGNDVILVPSINTDISGHLLFYYFLRPNQLVDETRAGIIASSVKLRAKISGIVFGSSIATITATAHGYATGDYVRLYNTNSSPRIHGVFQITVIDANTFTIPYTVHSGNAINYNFTTSAANASQGATYTNNGQTFTVLVPATASTTLVMSSTGMPLTSGTLTLVTGTGDPTITFSAYNNGTAGYAKRGTVTLTAPVPANLAINTLADFIEAKSGNKTKNFDVKIYSINQLAGTMQFDPDQLPDDLLAGDYVNTQNEAIVPQIPTELQPMLAQRVVSRCMEALGDTQGLTNSNTKLAEMEQKLFNLISNRGEGTPKKINNRRSILKYSRIYFRRGIS